jgi:hypothetical protein
MSEKPVVKKATVCFIGVHLLVALPDCWLALQKPSRRNENCRHYRQTE